MLWNKDNPNRNRQLDRLGRTLIRASRAAETDIEAAVSSPALLERIRARAATGEARPSGSINNRALNDRAADLLAAPLAIAWRAIPVLSLVAAAAIALGMSAANTGAPTNRAPNNQPENSFGNGTPGVEIIKSDPVATATACSVATKEECAVSTDDAVAILVSASAKGRDR